MTTETMQLWLDCYSIKNIALKTGQTCERLLAQFATIGGRKMARLKQYMWPVWWAVLTILILMALGGCATMDKAFQWAAAVNDEIADQSIDNLCDRLSMRAVREEFNTPETREAYNKLCGNTLYIER